MNLTSITIEKAVYSYNNFLDSCQTKDNNFKFTNLSEESNYALCFAIFGYHLIGRHDLISRNRDIWINKIKQALIEKRNLTNLSRIHYNKSYLQLLAFSLSALEILNFDFDNELKVLLLEVIPIDNYKYLLDIGVKEGVAGSGNFAMFNAIFLITLNNKYLIDKGKDIQIWIDFHLKNMNKFGFWGNSKHMTHLLFQNGYHQYEIFNYLSIKNNFWKIAMNNVLNLQDSDGFFAPYPGGGGCYDYDALYFLTMFNSFEYKTQIEKSLNSILNYQNIDGGFCESKFVRPRSFINIKKQFNHFLFAPNCVKFERLKYILTLQLSKHSRIHTHWTSYSREWNESDLWDSWFRMLSIARIDNFLKISNKKWGFINFPGIGFL